MSEQDTFAGSIQKEMDNFVYCERFGNYSAYNSPDGVDSIHHTNIPFRVIKGYKFCGWCDTKCKNLSNTAWGDNCVPYRYAVWEKVK